MKRPPRHPGRRRGGCAHPLSAAPCEPGLGRSEAADIVYTLMSPEVYRILTVERGWSARRYERWLAHTMRTQPLADVT